MENDNLVIKKISSTETYPVRHPILRSGRPLEDCFFEGDELETTLHFGLFKTNQLIGVASFFKTNNSSFKPTEQYQLRGMAVLGKFQGTGLGQILLNHSENELRKLGIELIWCNARVKAVPFYEKLNYSKKGNVFDINGIGPHFVMSKTLK